ncbi:glycosyltransferase involved in cell wall biosynthesis [Salibacterium salarium]|nr:glycosyltransferase involved in cell wall biosynthesis [Salibacterium salarium]
MNKIGRNDKKMKECGVTMTNRKGLSILYLTPYFYSKRGNATTAKRMKKYLEEAGHQVNVFAFEEEDGPIEDLIKESDIIHALHVRRTAEYVASKGITFQKPFVLTTGGTDVNIDLNHPKRKKQMEEFLSESEALTVFTEDGKDKVIADFPWLKNQVYVIPQAVEFESDTSFVPYSLPEGFPKLVLPAGLRPVKDVLFVLEELDKQVLDYPNLQFLIVGEVLDNNVAQQVMEASYSRPWLTYKDPLDSKQMIAVYKWADVVINTSKSEGQPMSLLEGMAAGIPALARVNPGNDSVIIPGYNGYLFTSALDFSQQLQRLFQNKSHYEEIAAKAADYVQTHHNPEEEAQHYIDLYYSLLSY